MLFERRINLILAIVVAAAVLAVGIPTAINRFKPSDSSSEEAVEETVDTTAATETDTEEKSEFVAEYSEVGMDPKSNRAAEPSEKKAVEKTTESQTSAETEATETETETESETEPRIFATAAPVETPASYDAQWNAGYLVAIDNPDTSYSVSHVELSDANRDLLERLCMGEFGEGGTTGAALIAQAVRDAMNYYGIDDVREIIKQLHYTGRTDIPASQSCKTAVAYVFDMDKSAIQHRILYMYNPKALSSGYSKFHETQRYICSFKSVRFFDR